MRASSLLYQKRERRHIWLKGIAHGDELHRSTSLVPRLVNQNAGSGESKLSDSILKCQTAALGMRCPSLVLSYPWQSWCWICAAHTCIDCWLLTIARRTGAMLLSRGSECTEKFIVTSVKPCEGTEGIQFAAKDADCSISFILNGDLCLKH